MDIELIQTEKTEETPPKNKLYELFTTFELLAFAAAIILLFFSFVARITVVEGGSMENTLMGGDKLIVSDDGTLYANGPTNTRQPLPDGVNGYYKYHGEIEVTGNLTKSDQDLGILVDEKIPKAFSNIVTFEDSDTVTLKFAEEQKFDLMWVYSSSVATYKIASMDVIVNGKYIYNDVKFGDAGAAPIVNLGKLPEGTMVKEITFQFTKAEGSDCSAIGEIVFSTKK